MTPVDCSTMTCACVRESTKERESTCSSKWTVGFSSLCEPTTRVEVRQKPEELVQQKPEELVQQKPEELVQQKPEELVQQKPEELVQQKPEELVVVLYAYYCYDDAYCLRFKSLYYYCITIVIVTTKTTTRRRRDSEKEEKGLCSLKK